MLKPNVWLHLMWWLRLVRLIAHLFKGLLICRLLFPRATYPQRQLHIQNWSAQLLRICRIQLTTNFSAQAPVTHALWVSNHVSWLDVIVFNSIHACVFVAKSEIRAWPLIGWLVAATDNLFIERGKRRAVHNVTQLVQNTLAQKTVMVFPEGTTHNGVSVLPFHANLFQAVVGTEYAVQPFTLQFLDSAGQVAESALFMGETSLWQSVKNLLQGSPLTAHVQALPVIQTGDLDRRHLAHRAHQHIAVAISSSHRST